jgi:hypothetical protein
MKIRYSVHSSFLLPCKAAIRNGQQALKNGATVSLDLPPGGYDGDVYVDIRSTDKQSFDTNWQNNDPTRFPVRIKAAATALKELGYVGRFRITHDDGALEICHA